MNNISGIVLSYNHESIITNTLLSLSKVCNEIILFDSLSTDNTLGIAKEFNCQIHQYALDNFRNQKNRAINACNNEWVFILDSDETMEGELINIIPSLINQNNVDCWGIPRKNYIAGEGPIHFPDYQMRLFKKYIQYGGHPIHHNVILNAKKISLAPQTGCIIHTKTRKMQDDSYKMYSTLCPEDFKPGQEMSTHPRNEEEAIRWKTIHVYNDYIINKKNNITNE